MAKPEYSAFSFDKKRLPYVVAYVDRQKVHHAQNELIPLLEKDGTEDSLKMMNEPLISYLTDYDQWFDEMRIVMNDAPLGGAPRERGY